MFIFINVIAPLLSGFFWTVTYIALVYRGFKDKSYGMPLVALALNFAWEVTFSVIYPPHAAGLMITVINIVWMICDIGIISTFFLYGYKYSKEQLDISKGVFTFSSILAFGFSFLIMIVGGPFFAEFSYFSGDLFETAKFIAFIQNAIMSILFVTFFYSRKKIGRPIEGQSFTIALMKFLGTSLTVGIGYSLDHKDNWFFVGIFIFMSFIFDLWYVTLIFKELKLQNVNPFRRL